ncbi:hypothetical protein PQX77_021245 [Marasmius sp. AFHP31]|nr:hypothetical protein PQX77_021245 [Marasmius sp. AFHP31]
MDDTDHHQDFADIVSFHLLYSRPSIKFEPTGQLSAVYASSNHALNDVESNFTASNNPQQLREVTNSLSHRHTTTSAQAILALIDPNYTRRDTMIFSQIQLISPEVLRFTGNKGFARMEQDNWLLERGVSERKK